MVLSHFVSGPFEAALDVEAFVLRRAIEDLLIASDLLGNIAQGSENVQPELLALLVFEYRNILNMTDVAEVANEFPLFEQRSGADDLATVITHHQEKVRIRDLGHRVILALPCLLRDVTDLGQDAERVQVIGCVVGALQRPNGVVGR